eukprot:Em0266g2a
MSRYIPGSDDTLHKQTRFVISTEMAMQWLDIYANENGDKLPTSGRILLPSSTTMTSVYQEYTEEYNGSGYVISKASFFRNWKKVHGNISIPKRSRFTVCTLCDLFATRIPTAKADKKDALVQARQTHLERVRVERQKYYSHCAKSRHDPKQYITLILDGMDQSKTYLPHFYHQSKAMINKALLKTHIIGGLTHGHGEYAYLSFGEFPQDSNLTLSILLSILNNINRKEHRLPDTLYLQMDNCSRENKNKYVYGVLGYLVLKGIFRKVVEDIDKLTDYTTEVQVYNGVYRPKAVSQKPLCEGDMVAVLPEKDQFTDGVIRSPHTASMVATRGLITVKCQLSYCRLSQQPAPIKIGANGPSHGGVNGTHSHCN